MTKSPLPSLRQLRAFDAILRTRSISAAAQAIHLTQPALSQSVRMLEKALGCVLLTRGANGTFPTAEGEILHRRLVRFNARLASLSDGGADVSWRLTLPQIRSLIEVARNGSFAGAARALGVSEASLHRAARDIEGILGRKLYRRSAEGIRVTRAGAHCAAQLNLALRELDQAVEELARHRGATGSRLLVGALPLVRTLLLPRVVNRITRDHPGTEILIGDGPYDALLSELRMGGTDFLLGALRSPPPHDDVVEEMLFMDHFAVVARAGHPLAGRGLLGPADLRDHDWIVARDGTPLRASFEAFFQGHPPPVMVETSSLVAIRAMLMESDKLTLLSRHQILFEETAGVLTTLPVSLPLAERPIGLTVRRDWEPTELQREFIARLREEASAEMRLVARL